MTYSPTSRHYDVLKKLFPLDVGGDFDLDLDIEGRALDLAENSAMVLHDEIFPDTSTVRTEGNPRGCLQDWERTYGVTPADGATQEQRIAVVMAKIRASVLADGQASRLNKAYFYLVASAFGYTQTQTDPKFLIIEDGVYRPFRAGYGRAGIDPVYDGGTGASMFTCVVRGTGVESDTDLRGIFNEIKAPNCDLEFVNVTA
jgi:uncharacterized protein YmfQ (DUF2313 family)